MGASNARLGQYRAGLRAAPDRRLLPSFPTRTVAQDELGEIPQATAFIF